MKTNDYKKLIEEYGSPVYIFDINKVKERINGIKEKLPVNAKLCYAIKANSFILKYLKDEDLLFEVCSPGELSICEEVGVNPSKIVFSGVCKEYKDVRRAYDLEVNTITLESKVHCDFLISILQECETHRQKIILRLSNGNQFGMSKDDLYECIEKLLKFSSIEIAGIHYFTGTQKKIKNISEEIAFIENFCNEVNKDFNIDLKYIEYGPGLSYEYFTQENQYDNFDELKQFTSFIKDSSWSYVIELGRYIASCCGKYITKIMDVKINEKGNYIIIDGGINHINYYGQMMGMKLPKVEHISNLENGVLENYTIAGSLCTTADIVLRQLPLKSPQINDLLVFNDIGAYSITEGIYLFLSHPLPIVIAKLDDKFELLRKSMETYKINH